MPLAYLAYLGVGLAFVLGGFATAWWLRRRAGYGGGSRVAYEGGEEPIGSPWVPFHARYYTVALVFLVFEVELAFMFPYALVRPDAQVPAGLLLAEGFLFVGILTLGLAFVWKAGLLAWPGGKAAGQAAPRLPERYAHIYRPPARQVR